MKADRDISIELSITVPFYDVDSMDIVWHGNYVKYLEDARCKLLDMVKFNYNDMKSTGYAWPVVSVQMKYIRPLIFNQTFTIRAKILEYENRLKIGYIFKDLSTGKKIHTAETVQMAIDMTTGDGLLVSPPCLIDAINKHIASQDGE